MVSIGSPVKWIGSKQMTPLVVKEEVTCSDDEEDEAFMSKQQYPKKLEISPLTKAEPNTEETSKLLTKDMHPNFKTILENFRSNAATRIQKYWLNKKAILQGNKFQTLILPLIARRLFSSILKSISNYYQSRNIFALKIQRAWRRYSSSQVKLGFTPPRKRLSEAVLIGSRILKIDSVLNLIKENRSHSGSPTNEDTPVKSNNTKRSYNYRGLSQVNSFRLDDNIIEESNLSIETIPEIPFEIFNHFAMNDMMNLPGMQKESDRKTLQRQNSIVRMRTKRIKSLSLKEIQRKFEIETEDNLS